MLAIYLSALETETARHKLTRLYESCEKKVYAVALQILQNPSQSEDAAQQAWLHLLRKWELVSSLTREKATGYAVGLPPGTGAETGGGAEQPRDRQAPSHSGVHGILADHAGQSHAEKTAARGGNPICIILRNGSGTP